ncbi:MAG: hypothetical protein EPN41_07680 [Candidimonas sp.]|nr:MAG: hypothetical protein EPN41_07680 [Candidimonas sp.]
MHRRTRVSAETLKRVSEQLAGIPVTSTLAEAHVDAIEALMRGVDDLRRLPLKELEPAVMFTPEEDLR